MQKNIIILTGNELRHQYFYKTLALHNGVHVLKTFCETEQDLLSSSAKETATSLKALHLAARTQSEKDFFESFVQCADDKSKSEVIPRGDINSQACYAEITALQPDLIIVYGASVIKEPLLSAFSRRILNVHLGLSPYYRGSATNFWPLVDGLPECVGATFMYIDAGIDTGEIIHQIRPEIDYHDTPSAIGNRLIKQMAVEFCKIITHFNSLQPVSVPQPETVRHYCKKKDYTEEAVEKLYANFNRGLICNYLRHKTTRDLRFPLVEQPLSRYDKSSHVSLCKES